MPGKRKRETTVVSRDMASETDDASTTAAPASHDVFRQFFESRFQPLNPVQVGNSTSVQEATTDGDSEEESEPEWQGITDEDEDEPQVEVVEHTDTRDATVPTLDKRARQAFMTAKPPSLSDSSATANSKSTKTKEDDEDAMDAENLKNDLALQRLLKESHLLESASDLNPTGKNRHKALDLRMQSLGAKKSLFEQEKMPMSHRKGIIAKAAKKEEVRRREARENGIILEKPTFKKKSSTKRRERGIGGPAVGKFAGGTLRLSKRDVMSITGPPQASKGAKKGRR
ncbi:hypothetical protein VTN77DRAFT_849 [Rasamsonia byssochlamydoides]|uniref:uncharacterized protein n=1 Tax=Rasamsonia byssochlamydoides TaxID=89139 RepID=UPI00374440B4